jgi:hypothetical protein
MLNYNVINIILKKACKCHCYQDAIVDYCFDHTTNEDDFQFMTFEQYLENRDKKPLYSIKQGVARNKGIYYIISIDRVTRNTIYFRLQVLNAPRSMNKCINYNRKKKGFVKNGKLYSNVQSFAHMNLEIKIWINRTIKLLFHKYFKFN